MEMEATCCRGEAQFSQGKKAALETGIFIFSVAASEAANTKHRVTCWRSSWCVRLVSNKGEWPPSQTSKRLHAVTVWSLSAVELFYFHEAVK